MPRRTRHPGLRAHSWRTAGGEVRTAYYLDNRAGQVDPDKRLTATHYRLKVTPTRTMR